MLKKLIPIVALSIPFMSCEPSKPEQPVQGGVPTPARPEYGVYAIGPDGFAQLIGYAVSLR